MVYVVRYALIALYTVLWGSISILCSLVDRSGELPVRAARRWVRWILATCRIRIDAKGLEQLDLEHPCVFMSNHQSVFDIAAIMASLPVSLRFVAKRELVWIPFFGWALWLGRHVIVDRSNRERSIASLERAARQIAGGTNVIVFPEGTRSPTGELGTFKSGGFHLALAARVPIVPISISGSKRITPKGSLRIESGEIRLRYGAPIPTERLALEDRETLKATVRAAIAAGLESDVEPDFRADLERADARR